MSTEKMKRHAVLTAGLLTFIAGWAWFVLLPQLPQSGNARSPATSAVKRVVDVGDEAPDFEVMSESGESVRLSDFRSRWVILIFQRAHW